jgi:hypothetical protein
MVIGLIVVFLAIVVALSLKAWVHTPWLWKIRHLRIGVGNKVEWMASDAVIKQIESDYLQTFDWLHESLVSERLGSPGQAAGFLTGHALKRYQMLVVHYQRQQVKGSRFIGVLRADHHVEVRHFSEDGSRCLVIDRQTNRRMATYDRQAQVRLHTQDLGDGAVVYRMVYDDVIRRWKLEAFVQELPAGWGSRRVRLLTSLPTAIGRDH